MGFDMIRITTGAHVDAMRFDDKAGLLGRREPILFYDEISDEEKEDGNDETDSA